jgi:DNA-binding transcriptional ArsR family regulator
MTKTELFDQDLQYYSSIFKALAHPARLTILKYLARTKSCISGDISNELPLSRTTVNQHLKELKKLGMVKGEVEGVKTNYCIDFGAVKKAKELLDTFFTDIKCC